jgi:hypothetical protein
MRNEYFRKVPLPGGTYELASTSERFLLPGGTYELASTFERFLLRRKPCAAQNTDHLLSTVNLSLWIFAFCMNHLHVWRHLLPASCFLA